MAIARCKSAGKFRVEFTELARQADGSYEHGSMKLAMHQHPFDVETRDGSPILDSNDPYEGELCEHELTFLRHMPGKAFNYKWRFDVSPLTRGRKGA